MRIRTVAILLSLGILAPAAAVRSAPPRYEEPSSAIVAIVDAAPTPAVSVGPKRASMIILERQGLPMIADLAQPELRLAGLRINPRTNGRSRAQFFIGLQVMDLGSGQKTDVTGLPTDPRLGHTPCE